MPPRIRAYPGHVWDMDYLWVKGSCIQRSFVLVEKPSCAALPVRASSGLDVIHD